MPSTVTRRSASERVAQISSAAQALAREVVAACEKTNGFRFVYDDALPLWQKVEAIATQVYGAAGITASAAVKERIERLQAEAGDQFPEKVTAFRVGMAVHGRYRQPCPDCGAPVQRVVYAANEANYCAQCQTGGRLLADRSLSRLLREDWPRTLDELERRRRGS